MAGFSSTRTLATLFLAAAAFASPAELWAKPVSGGEVGPVSTASVRISLSIAPRLGTERASPAQGARLQYEGAAQPLCIWSNTSLGTFSVNASELSAAGRPGGQSGSAAAYELEWRDGAGGSRVAPVRSETELSGLAGRSRGACQAQGRPAGELVVKPASGPRDSAMQGDRAVLLLIAPD